MSIQEWLLRSPPGKSSKSAISCAKRFVRRPTSPGSAHRRHERHCHPSRSRCRLGRRLDRTGAASEFRHPHLQVLRGPVRGSRCRRIADLVAGIADGHRPDLVLIVRGGGAPAGLASLANLSLARAVSRCPVPIITGLGHASDRTIIDDCAWFAANMPTRWSTASSPHPLRLEHRSCAASAASLLLPCPSSGQPCRSSTTGPARGPLFS